MAAHRKIEQLHRTNSTHNGIFVFAPLFSRECHAIVPDEHGLDFAQV